MTKWLTLFCVMLSMAFAETGYIEGDYRYISAPQSGWITTSNVSEGQTIAVNTLVFTLDAKNQQLAVEQAQIALTQAKANVAQAQAKHNQAIAKLSQAKALFSQSESNLKNLQTGSSEAVLNVYRKQRSELFARLNLAKSTLKRYEKLQRSNAVSAIEVDQAQSAVDTLNAQIHTVDAQIKEKAQSARIDVIDSAKSGMASAQAGVDASTAMLAEAKAGLDVANAMIKSAEMSLKQAQEKRAERDVRSLIAGKVTQIYRFQGEFVGAGTPILQLLNDKNRKVIFFAPEAKLMAIKLGGTVNVTGDNAKTTATISHIADTAEYTPPMLYTEKSRGDLVFRVEANLDAPLPIGLPVEVAW